LDRGGVSGRLVWRPAVLRRYRRFRRGLQHAAPGGRLHAINRWFWCQFWRAGCEVRYLHPRSPACGLRTDCRCGCAIARQNQSSGVCLWQV